MTQWFQINHNGFGDPDAPFRARVAIQDGDPSFLYASAHSRSGDKVWRLPSRAFMLEEVWDDAVKRAWQDVTPPWADAAPVSSNAPPEIGAMTTYRGAIYLGTNRGEIWRTRGAGWELVRHPDGPEGREESDITAMARFGNDLYVARTSPRGAVILRTRDGVSWETVSRPGFDDPGNNFYVTSLAAYRWKLYAGTGRQRPGSGGDGCEVWMRNDDETWTQVNIDGFGYQENAIAKSMAATDSHLFVGTVNHSGAQVWRYDGEWRQVTPEEFVLPEFSTEAQRLSPRVQSMTVFGENPVDERLYGEHVFIGEGNVAPSGGQVYGANVLVYDGRWYIDSPAEGFDNVNNRFIESLVGHSGYLFAGTTNQETGCEIWRGDLQLSDRITRLGEGDRGIPDLDLRRLFDFVDRLPRLASDLIDGLGELGVWGRPDLAPSEKTAETTAV